MRERRKDVRLPVQVQARVLYGWQNVARCELRDLTASGALIKMDAAIPLPSELDLFARNPLLEKACRVVWRQGDRCGVAFEK
jgi:hypothetical protein